MILREWETKSFGPYSEKIPELVEYLSHVWKNRNKYVDSVDEENTEEKTANEKVQKQGFFSFSHDNKITAHNYVGTMQYEDIRIEVMPKIFDKSEKQDSGNWHLNLIYWLSYCRKIRFPFSFANISDFHFDDYLELMIYVFANHTEEVLFAQPYQSYQTIEEETSFLRGRLSFDNYTKHNLSKGKWQHFHCIHEPFAYDNLFNRIVKYVSKRLLAVSNNFITRQKLNEIFFLLDEVTDIQCTAPDCSRVSLNSLYGEHGHILELCRMFMSNLVIDMHNEQSRNFCFLLPMEYVFEDFIFGFIDKHFPDMKFLSQSTDYLARHNGEKVFQIRNDMYLKDKLIIDTKYKVRKDANDKKAGVSQTDIYQMVSYALIRNCRDVLLIYPETQNEMSTSAPVSFEVPSEMIQDNLRIDVRNIDITFDDIKHAEEKIIEQIKKLHPVIQDNLVASSSHTVA